MKRIVLLALFVFLVNASNVFSGTGDLDSKRIEEASYKLIMYNQLDGEINNIGLLQRDIKYTNYEGKSSITITEVYRNNEVENTTIVIISREDLAPLYQEKSRNDTLFSKTYFEGETIRHLEYSSGTEEEKKFETPENAYISNSFSELVQANNFEENKEVTFRTFSPGREPASFKVERIGEEEFYLPGKESFEVYVLKFTMTTSDGTEKPGGYRYIDKKSGKVLAFRTEIDSNDFFTYQMVFLEY